jgi:ADP-ribose pyrophosphatase YjhB (NUDIX family)
VHDGKLLVTKRNKFGHEYYILVGGGVGLGESLEQALLRQLAEETGVRVANPRLVFTENAGMIYGLQNIFVCDYQGGEPRLDPESAEAKISALGRNTYEPMWLPLTQLPLVKFRSERLRDAVLKGLEQGFPEQPADITDGY